MGTRQSSISLRARAGGLAAVSVVVLTALAIPLSASAANTFNVTIQQAADVRQNPCSALDLINFQSTLHMVMHVTATRTGYTVGLENNWVASGSSIVTGVEYRGAETTYDSTHVGTGDTETFVRSMLFTSQADVDDLLLHAKVHVTVNAAGVPTAEVEQATLECKG